MTGLAVVHGALVIAACAAAIPAIVLLVQVIAALQTREAPVPPPQQGSAVTAERPLRVAVLVPAHDEEAGIMATIASVRAQLKSGDAVLVVADNCVDQTASAARESGADVVERHDALHRGKGYALDFGVRALAARSPLPDVVVVIDADCLLGPGALERVARLSHDTGRPAQATYLMLAPEAPSLAQRLSAFAWIVRNRVRPLGACGLGWPCQLMGTGMAFPWRMIAAAPLASGNLVEDLQLGVVLGLAGTPPTFCSEAVVWSRFPTDVDAAVSQRTRWEHGHLSMLFRSAPRLAGAGIVRGRPELLAMALDLAVPPLAALVAVQALLVSSSLALWIASDHWLALAIAFPGLVLVALAVILAWRRFGRETVTATDLAQVPGYVLRKLSMYGRWFFKRETRWIRTRR